jgi:hypothetical protein
MVNHRNRPRKNTPHLVRVLDSESGRVLGRVVDITADGLLLMSTNPMDIGRKIRIRVVLPVMVNNRSDVEIDAEIVWSKQDPNPSYFQAGIKFLSLPGDDGFLLEDVMHKLNLVG